MKKVIYSMALVLTALCSCTTWDEPYSENYGAGPEIAVNLTAGTPSDSSFVLNITPGEGTYYYSYVIDESDADETADLDAATLLKGSYGGEVLNAKTAGEEKVQELIDGLTPNTTYQVYAVASNDKGIVGTIAHASITTTDGLAPAALSLSRDAENNAVKVGYSEALTRGEGAVTAKYYKEWDIMNPVDIDEDDIVVTINGKVVTFAVTEVPTGAYLCFSYEEGAFVDGFGNKVSAMSSGLNMTTGKFTNLYVQVPTVAFTVTDSNVTSPANKFTFSSADEFKGELTFDFDLYRNDVKVEEGDLSVTYTGQKRTVTYKLGADDWAVEGSKLTFTLPAEPTDGDLVTLSIVEGAFTDVLGNPNASYTSALTWTYSLFKPTVDNVLGTFNYYVTLNSNGNTYNLGPVTISEYTGEDAEEGDVVISGLYLGEDAKDIYGYYDLGEAKLYIYRYQALGTYEDGGETYGVLTYSVGGNKEIPFDITEDGLVSTDFALAYSDAAYSSLQGWEVPAGTTNFVKVQASAARATASAKNKKSQIVKGLKGSPKRVKAIRK